jgi:hypothetical protein
MCPLFNYILLLKFMYKKYNFIFNKLLIILTYIHMCPLFILVFLFI